MEEKKITGQESLYIIQQMIEAAKKEQKDDGKGWILWGWLLFFASLLTIINLQLRWYSTYFFWNVFGIACLVLVLYTIIKTLFFKKPKRVRTYTRDLFEKLNIGFFIFLMFIIVSINLGVGPIKGFALLIGLYGFWILIYGTALNFKPSIIASFIVWSMGFACLFMESFLWVMVIHSLAVLSGYIIPGYIANKEFKKINRTEK